VDDHPSGAQPDSPEPTTPSEVPAPPGDPMPPSEVPAPPGDPIPAPPSAMAAPPEGPAPVAWEPATPTKSSRGILIVGAIVVVIVVVAIVGLIGYINANLSPYDEATNRVAQRLEADPAFKAKYGNLDHDAAVQAGITLVKDGVDRVDDATQLTLFQATAKVLDLADPDSCSALAQGTEDPDIVVPILKKLDQETLDSYFDATATAALASVHGDPLRDAPTDDEQAAAGAAWSVATGADKFQADLGVLQDPAGHTASEVCDADRELIHAALTLGEQDRTTIVRVVYKGSGG